MKADDLVCTPHHYFPLLGLQVVTWRLLTFLSVRYGAVEIFPKRLASPADLSEVSIGL